MEKLKKKIARQQLQLFIQLAKQSIYFERSVLIIFETIFILKIGMKNTKSLENFHQMSDFFYIIFKRPCPKQ